MADIVDDLEEQLFDVHLERYIDGQEVQHLEENDNADTTDSDGDDEEEQQYTSAASAPCAARSLALTTSASESDDQIEFHSEQPIAAPSVKRRNAFEVLQAAASKQCQVSPAQARRDIRKRKKLARKQQMWEQKVQELERKNKEWREPYLKKSIKDFRKLIQRDNRFNTPNEWLPPAWSPVDVQRDSVTLQLVDIDDITSITSQWSRRWHPTDVKVPVVQVVPEHERDTMAEVVIEGQVQRPRRQPSADAAPPAFSIPILRLHCLTATGAPVLVRVHGVRPYFYARVPQQVQHMSDSWLCNEVQEYLEKRLDDLSFVKGKQVIRVQIEEAQSVMGFHFTRNDAGDIVSKLDRFFKITVAMPSLVQNCKNILQPYKKQPDSGVQIRDEATGGNSALQLCLDLFDCEKTLPFQFLTDHKLSGQSWFTLPAQSYEVVRIPRTNYATEIDTHFETMQYHSSNDEKYSAIAPSRFFSFDIECASKSGHFPKAENDPVISIAVSLQDSTWKTPPRKAIFTYRISKDQYHKSWKGSTANKRKHKKRAPIQVGYDADTDAYSSTCAAEPLSDSDEEGQRSRLPPALELDDPNRVEMEGVEVFMRDDEEDMLLSFSEFMRDCDPGVITGYNILNFDIPYLCQRAQVLDLEGFPFWGATLEPLIPEFSMFNSAAWGQQERVNLNIPGRVIYDFLRWIKPEVKLKSYTLNSVAEFLLKQTKDDLHHSSINRMFYGPSHARRRLFKYNVKDADLPLLMIQKRLSWVRDSEMSRVCNVVIPWLTNRGQGVKTMSQLQPRMKDEKLLRPYTPKPPRSAQSTGELREVYEGADVLEPVKGLHTNPVATLDYNSLYPSIMITWNICYTTLIAPDQLHLLGPDDYHTVIVNASTGEKRYFVKRHIREGLLPRILSNLLNSRANAKVEMKAALKAMDQVLYEVLDSRQLALKVSANSVYGFPAAYMLPCPALAAAVTYYGRQLIQLARDRVQKRFCRANGYTHDARVLYGDTDSIMIDFGTSDLALVSKLALEAQNMLNAEFKKQPGSVVKIEAEKIYVHFLLLAPKNYAGYKLPPDSTQMPPKELLGTKQFPLDMKGIETVRRDKIGLSQRLCEQTLIKCLRDLDPNGAIEYCKQEITKLLQGKIDLSELILSKALQLYYDEDSVQPAHARLAQKLKERDPESAPRTGDRVKYVLVCAGKRAKKSEQAEDPYYAMVNHLPIDYLGYFTSHLKNALTRLLTPIVSEKRLEELWALAKTVRCSHSQQVVGTLAAFVTPQGRCRNCHVHIPNQPNALICTNCLPLAEKYKAMHLQTEQALETEVNTLWDNCKTCVGPDSDEQDCNYQECQFWFKRWIKRDELETSRRLTQQWMQF